MDIIIIIIIIIINAYGPQWGIGLQVQSIVAQKRSIC